MRLSARDDQGGVTFFPWATLNRRVPDAPELSIDPSSDWEENDGLLTARIGDSGAVFISGSLPEGRYPASVRLLSRVIDAQTGDPIGPASFTVQQFTASATGKAKIEKGNGEPVIQTLEGWSTATFSVGTIVNPVATEPSAVRLKASAVLSLRDLPEIQAGRSIEVAAELVLYGDTDIRSNERIELLIAEPSLDLTIRSPDQDRAINLHDVTPVVVLSCNQGNSSAEAIILTARLPDGLTVDDATDARVFLMPARRTNDRAFLFSNDPPSLGEAYFDAPGNVLRGAMTAGEALEPNTCLALAFKVRRSELSTSQSATATIRASVEPYTGRPGIYARIYPGTNVGEIRFNVPSILFGPVSEREVLDERSFSHILTLEVPAAAIQHRRLDHPAIRR